MSNNNQVNYRTAGVDIDAGNKFVEMIKPLVKSTNRIGVDNNFGGFGALFDIKKCNFSDPVLVSATDGVGTKLKLAILADKHDTIGIDLVAMSVNDLVVQGAQPLFFLDYFSCSKLDIKKAKDIVKGIAEGCKMANCALIGGETAEMPGIYHNKDYDLAGFAVGAVERDEILPKLTQSGDVIIGIKSSGLHSNGFSLARYIIDKNNINYNLKAFDDKTILDHLLTPTKIYVNSCLKLMKDINVKAFAHITGGGIYENMSRVIAKNLEIRLEKVNFKRPEIFNFLQKEGNICNDEMIRTFNCGIGMVAIINKQDVDKTCKILQDCGEDCLVIGQLN
jgi:phosphoribosylaminoimidazole synthetase